MRRLGLEAVTFRVWGDELAVLSVPALEPERIASLTTAERAVVELLLEGRSNRAIARARGVAERTVANQVASILSKLGVSSRSELAARWP